jgi:hypothetical protein
MASPFSMQNLLASLPGSTSLPNLSNPMSLVSSSPQINKQQLATGVQNIKDDRNQKLAMMLYALGGALKGQDPLEQSMKIRDLQQQTAISKYAGNYLRSQGASEEMIKLAEESPALATQIITQQFDYDKPSSVEEYEYAVRDGFKGSYADFKKSGAMSFNIDQTSETDFVKSLVKLGEKDIEETREAMKASNELLPKLQTAQVIIQSEDFQTGPTTEITMPLRKLYSDITGQDASDISQQELFMALSNYSVPRMRPPGSGATSDFEAVLYSQATIGLGNTKEGNELILGTMIQQAKRDQLIAELKEDYFKQHRGDTTGFTKYLKDNDLVPALYQKINLDQQNIGEMYDQGKIQNGEVYVDMTDPRRPKLQVFRLSDFISD